MAVDDVHVIQKLPFLRIFPLFAVGILCGEKFQFPYAFLIIALAGLCCIVFIFHLFPAQVIWKIKMYTGSILLMMILLLGMICRTIHPFFLTKKSSIQEGCHILRIEQILQKNKQSIRTECSVFVKNNNTWVYKNKCLISIRNRKESLMEGMVMMAYIQPSYIKPLHNPGAYNYAFQQHIKGIFYQAAIDEKSHLEFLGMQGRTFSLWMTFFRDRIIEILRKSLHDKEIYGLAEAMMIGYRDDLDSTILNSYINTGVVHVIAISGMHLSLIFLLIDLFVGLILKKNRKDIIGLFITIPILWLFAMLTGSSASVVRSALMLTFILISKALGKQSSGMNALFGSAFMLTAWSPWMIYDLGFQLSYLAVASMMLFEKPIRHCIFTNNIILTKGWEMISVTLAAQILTTPISIFHFHQFPLLFLFTNLLAIPLSSLILLAEIALCLMDAIHIPHGYIDLLTQQMITGLNFYIARMEHVPWGMIKHIHVGLYTTLMIYCTILVGKFLLGKPFFKYIYSISIFILISFGVQQYESYLKKKQTLFIIPNMKKGMAFYYKKGNKIVIICSQHIQTNKQQLQLIKNQLMNQYWVKEVQVHPIIDTPMVLRIKQKRRNNPALFMITGNPPGIEFLSTLNISSENLVIADATNKLWKIHIWETEAEKLLLRFHSVSEAGPLILDLPE